MRREGGSLPGGCTSPHGAARFFSAVAVCADALRTWAGARRVSFAGLHRPAWSSKPCQFSPRPYRALRVSRSWVIIPGDPLSRGYRPSASETCRYDHVSRTAPTSDERRWNDHGRISSPESHQGSRTYRPRKSNRKHVSTTSSLATKRSPLGSTGLKASIFPRSVRVRRAVAIMV